jgi:hypothetical protein
MAGGIILFGPAILTGEARSEKTGSVRTIVPSIFIKKVECPIQIK